MTTKYVIQTASRLKEFHQAGLLTGLSVAIVNGQYRVVYEVAGKMWGYLSDTRGKKIREYSAWNGAMNAANSILGGIQWVDLIEPQAPLEEAVLPESYELIQE